MDKLAGEEGGTLTAERKVKIYSTQKAEELRKIYLLLNEADIPYIYMGPKTEEDFPHIEWGYLRYEYITGIKRFVENWKRGKIPPFEPPEPPALGPVLVDSSELAPQLLARWNGAEDLIRGINKSLGHGGKCRQILQDLESGKLKLDYAISDLIAEIEKIHKETH